MITRIRFPFFETQTALYSRITEHFASVALAVPGFSIVVPEETAFPYWVLSQLAATPSQYKGRALWDVTATIDCYSDKLESTQEVSTVMSAVVQAITKAELSFPGGFKESFGLGKLEQSEIFGEPDGPNIIFRGIVRYKWVVEDTQTIG